MEFFNGRANYHIENPDNINSVSMASIWEIAIKISLNKLQMKTPLKNLSDYISESGFHLLPIEFEHTLLVSTLDFHHRDPFDRLIVSQAIIENMSIISRDRNFDLYSAERIW